MYAEEIIKLLVLNNTLTMNKKISLALIALFVLGAMSASAQTTDATNTGAVGLPPKPQIAPSFTNTRAQMETREKALRAGTTVPKQTQGSTFGEKKRELMEKRAEALRASTTAARANIKDEAMKKRFAVARKQTELVTKRLEAAIARVQKLSDRVSERLNKLETEGVNVSVSRSHLANAKVKLEEARTKTAAVKLAIETIYANATATSGAATTTPKHVFKDVQGLVKDATKSIQEAHRDVALAISNVKPGLNKPRPATTTATTNSTTTAQ